MDWAVRLSREAERQLKRIPRDYQERLLQPLVEMTEDPFRGNVKPLKGKEWRGRYRKVAGPYRIIFIPYHQARTLEVSAILLRSEKSYR